MLPGRLAGLGPPVQSTPGADDPLDARRGVGAGHSQEPGLGLPSRHAGQDAHLGVGQLAPREGFGEPRQRAERVGDAPETLSAALLPANHGAEDAVKCETES